MIDKDFKYRRIVPLWLQVFFYSVIGTVVYAIISPSSVGLSDWFTAVFPVIFSRYWYFTAYFALFFFIPYINRAINSITKRSATILVITLFVLFSILPTIRTADIFFLKNGYSPFWLATMYVFGAYFKKYGIANKIKKRYAVIAYVGAVVLTWVSKYAIMFLLEKFSLSFGHDVSLLFISYTSPTIILSALALFVLFSKIVIRGKFIQKAVTLLSTLTFSVYIIHLQPVIRKTFIDDKFIWLTELNPFLMILCVLGFALVIYIACSAIDYVRLLIFKLLKIDTVINKAADKLHKKFLSE